MNIAENTFVSLLRATTYLAVCLLTALPLPARATSEQKDNSAASLTFADVQQSASQTNCPRKGTAHIRLGQHLFFVPRILLVHVENDKGLDDTSWRCSDSELNARSFFIDARSSQVGKDFYIDWIERRKLPRSIHFAIRGKFKHSLNQRFESRVEKGEEVRTTELGLRYIEFPGQTYYDASAIGLHAFDGQPVVYQCSPRHVKGNARVCSTYYNFDESIDLRYRFLDPPFLPEGWFELDARTRQLVLELLKPPTR